jgi:hypothetical protein
MATLAVFSSSFFRRPGFPILGTVKDIEPFGVSIVDDESPYYISSPIVLPRSR